MISQRSAEQAINLADQGWTVSAIARHLDHDRKTIRIYLTGHRTPGQPRQQADSFTPFAGYAARRLRDDPHLRAAGLHRELAVLGYAGSYSALTRELRNSGIPTTCLSCRDQPGSSYIRARTQHRRQHLPMPVTPITGETIASYLTRLARSNHLSDNILLAYLPPWFTARSLIHDDLSGAAQATDVEVAHLAALTGVARSTLLHALPALTLGAHHDRPTVRATHACQRCAARHVHAERVPVHLPAHRRICSKHRRWLGDTTQIDCSAAPEIVRAHRRADRLARRGTEPHLILAEIVERGHILAARRHGTRGESVERRIATIATSNPRITIDHPDLIGAATYPETIIGVTSALRRPKEPTIGPK